MAGLKRYFTGTPCKRNHVAERFANSGRCVECNKIICGEWQEGNREWINTYRVEWYDKNKEERRRYRSDWYYRDHDKRKADLKKRRSNPEVLAKHNRVNAEWRKANPEYFSEWAKKNPERYKALAASSKQRRRSREAAADGSHTAGDILQIVKAQKGKCAYCRQPLGRKYQVDHIVPISKGGSNYPSNLQLLCENRRGARSCNQIKRDADPVEFARSLGLLL